MRGESTSIAWICAVRRVNPATRVEENRPRWGARTSNPCGAASLSLVGSTPTLFRQHRPELLASNRRSPSALPDDDRLAWSSAKNAILLRRARLGRIAERRGL